MRFNYDFKVLAIQLLLVIGLGMQCLADVDLAEWISPDKQVKMVVVGRETKFRSVLDREWFIVKDEVKKGVASSSLLKELNRGEYAGKAWIESVEPSWYFNRYLVFESDAALCVIDTKEACMVLNNYFLALQKDPKANCWAAIRLRAGGRNETRLDDSYSDDLHIIELEKVCELVSGKSDSQFRIKDLTHLNLNGVALLKPLWIDVTGGHQIAVAIWNGLGVEGILIRSDSPEVILRKKLDVKVASDDVSRFAFPIDTGEMMEKALRSAFK